MDPVESFNNLLDDEVDYSDDAYWVEAAWRHEDTSDVSQHGAGEQRDDDGVKCFEAHQEGNLSGLAESAFETLPEEEGMDVALVTTERKPSYSSTQLHRAQKPRQSVSSEDSRSVVERGHFRSSISRGPYKCDSGCDIPAFRFPKDLRRHINDIHETRTRYRCPVNGCKYNRATVSHSIKRKDNFRRHLQNKHSIHSAGIDLEWLSVVV